MDSIQFQKKKSKKTKTQKYSSLLKGKDFGNTVIQMGLCYQRKDWGFLLKNLLCFEEKIVAAHLWLFLDRSISFNSFLHTNCFIACCVKISVPEYIVFNYKMINSNSQEIFCCLSVWVAISWDNYIKRLVERNEEQEKVGWMNGNLSPRETVYSLTTLLSEQDSPQFP